MKPKDLIRFYSSDPKRRRAARFRILKGYAKSNDFHIYKDHLIWKEDAEFCAARAAYPLPGIPDDRVYVLFSAARSLAEVPGDLAECGTRYGKSASLLRYATRGSGKVLHLFDSFEGVSAPDPEDDGAGADAWRWSKGMLTADEDTVRRNLSGLDDIEFHRGWIPERFVEVADRRFSLAHVDVDLYQPTLESMEFFYPRLSAGGILVCDDYGSRKCPGAYKAVNEFMADKPEGVLHLPTGQSLVYKQQGRRQ